MKTLGRYKITYFKNYGILSQYKDLISHIDYEKDIKQRYEDLKKEKNLKEYEKQYEEIEKYVKETYGDNWFTDQSPLYLAKETGILILSEYQGKEHKVKIEQVYDSKDSSKID